MRDAGIKRDFTAKRLMVNGIVQGVGFRPFVYQLAKKYYLEGEVANSSSGVDIHVEGKEDDIKNFTSELTGDSPPLAMITDISSYSEEIKNYKEFIISESIAHETVSTLISPDVSICDDCLNELFDPDDRRYKYPFINCTNCGPRYTIIYNIPYDRPNTSMKKFQMCDKCQAEYDDPSNRRFHAQPNACDNCGPHVYLYDNNGNKIKTEDPVRKTANLLKKGYIVAIKGLGGFHLAADAENKKAVSNLRKRKHREEKPFAVMSIDLDNIRKYAYADHEDERLLKASQRPIVLLRKRGSNCLSEEISPRNKYFGVMLPYTPLHYLILAHGFKALVMTSGNISEEPIASDNKEAFEWLSNIADYFLMHDRDIYLRSDDSIVMKNSGETMLVRRSRGYVPVPIYLKRKYPDILACGAELKNTICLVKENNAFLSQHIGDLENKRIYNFFRQTIKHMKNILDINPKIVACDLHPDYLSSRYALEQKDRRIFQVQHHHAHIASCMAENRIEGEVIGFSFDGTGYGPDNSIWGGEILIVQPEKYIRAATISHVSMPGSGSAIKEPWKMAVSYLYDVFKEDVFDLDIPLLREIPENDIKVIVEMILKKINSPLTSSLGRLFDGVAAITGIRSSVYYEGQAAMELEMLAAADMDEYYEYEWDRDDIYRVKLGQIIRGVVDDMREGIDAGRISSKFHMTLIRMYSELCGVIGKDTGLKRVALSGGVFQNSILLKGLKKSLRDKGFDVYTHSLVPANDAGVSLGQAMIAAAMAEN